MTRADEVFADELSFWMVKQSIDTCGADILKIRQLISVLFRNSVYSNEVSASFTIDGFDPVNRSMLSSFEHDTNKMPKIAATNNVDEFLIMFIDHRERDTELNTWIAYTMVSDKRPDTYVIETNL